MLKKSLRRLREIGEVHYVGPNPTRAVSNEKSQRESFKTSGSLFNTEMNLTVGRIKLTSKTGIWISG